MSLVFSAFSLKGPNSQVSQIPHCTGRKEGKQKEGQKKKRNLIQLIATIIWMSHCSEFFFFFFFSIWIQEREKAFQWEESSHFGMLHLLWGRGRGGRREKKKESKGGEWRGRGGHTWAWIGTRGNSPHPKSTLHDTAHRVIMLTGPNHTAVHTTLPDPGLTVSWRTGQEETDYGRKKSTQPSCSKYRDATTRSWRATLKQIQWSDTDTM